MEWHEIKMNKKFADWIISSEMSVFNILEGGVRSGKTTTMILAFCRAIERLVSDSVNIAFAESIALARAILGEGGSGLGILNYFGERAREGQYKGKDAIFIKIRNVTHIVIFVGSKNSDSFKSIRGLTITLAMGTEVSLAHPTFMEEIVARTLSTPMLYRRLFFDTNPTMSQSYIYTDFIDRWVDDWKKGKLLGGVNYNTCSLFENPALTDEQAQTIISQYDTESSFYKALILGMRMNSTNNVYTLRSYNLQKVLPLPVEYIIIIDVGVSSSATTFITMGRTADNKLYVYDSYYHRNGPKTIENVKEYSDYGDDLVSYYNKETLQYGFPPRFVFVDRDITMMRILTAKFLENDIPKSKVQYAIKDKINSRIIAMSNMLYTGQLIIQEDLKSVRDAIENAVYDEVQVEKGELKRLDDTRLEFNPVDILDPIEYGISYYMQK